MRFRLRTLLIVALIMPPLLAAAWWGALEWQRRRADRIAAENFRVEFRLSSLSEDRRRMEEFHQKEMARKGKAGR